MLNKIAFNVRNATAWVKFSRRIDSATISARPNTGCKVKGAIMICFIIMSLKLKSFLLAALTSMSTAFVAKLKITIKKSRPTAYDTCDIVGSFEDISIRPNSETFSVGRNSLFPIQ